MKKRSMLALASLATGFVVAAVTPSHAVADGAAPLDAGAALGALDRTAAEDNTVDLDVDRGSRP
ncbi:hypothetical protein ABTY20_10495 [Streptomyces sp. NPDC126497]|uniref:hypothetical protein n=1 Tax=Streptomyces sp. NPDC126497 TaxID=3155313 RepID=UPI00331DDD87